MQEPKISILTATLNAGAVLPRLMASLRAQTDKDFDWIVADGGSTDTTLGLLRNADDLRIRITEAPDFGIYDALNRGVGLISEGYYLVAGADDLLEPSAIEGFRQATRAAAQPDFVAAAILQSGHTILPRKGLGWLYGIQGVASSHAVGLLIRHDLHARHGLYTSKLPIAADQLFVKKALMRGATIAHAGFLAGEFSDDGMSGRDPVGVLTEIFRSQLLTERYQLPQYIIFGLRLGKHYLRSLLPGRRRQ